MAWRFRTTKGTDTGFFLCAIATLTLKNFLFPACYFSLITSDLCQGLFKIEAIWRIECTCKGYLEVRTTYSPRSTFLTVNHQLA